MALRRARGKHRYREDMPESRANGPAGYAEVSGTAGSPHPQAPGAPEPPASEPFTPPDTSSMGHGVSAGGTAGEGGNGGGGLAKAISGGGKLMDLLPEAAEVAAL